MRQASKKQNDGCLVRAPPLLTFEEIVTMPACSATVVNALFFGPMPFKHNDYFDPAHWWHKLFCYTGIRFFSTSFRQP